MDCVNKINLNNEVRLLWMQHSEWTGMAFTSVIFGNPDEEAVIERLLRNPKDFARFLGAFYGDKTARRFGKLLTEHLSLAVALVEVTMAEDAEEADRISAMLFENADEISRLLADINPYWHYESWRNMFYVHLDLAIAMAGQRINGKYRESIHTYDRFEAEVMTMANMMVKGIIQQFYRQENC